MGLRIREDERKQGWSRRGLVAAAGVFFSPALARAAPPPDVRAALAEVELRVGGRLGVAFSDGAGRSSGHRGAERFPMCSTFKVLAAAHALALADRGRARLDERLTFGRTDLLDYAPIARARIGPAIQASLSLGEACAAAVELSDNTAANLVLKRLGGPPAVTAWLRSQGDLVTRLDRTEPELNLFTPGDPRDTTSPQAMLVTLQAALLGSVLSPASRMRLVGWMGAATTGKARLRAGLDPLWPVGDKTGTWTGALSSANDVALVQPPDGPPWLIAAFLTETRAPAAARDAALADVARILSRAFAQGGPHGL